MTLSIAERERYARQMMMAGWGEETQRKLKQSTVFIAGAGGLGSPVAMYLAVAGIGHLRICDFDSPETSNLNRQILHDPSRVGVNKAVSAKMTLHTLNADVEVTAIDEKLTSENATDLIGDSALVMDCMDNFDARYVLNAVAIEKRIPLVHGGIWGIDGQLTFVNVPETPCLQCLFPEPPAKEIFPVVGATPGVIGTLQAMEAIKYLTGIGRPVAGELLTWRGSTMHFRRFKVAVDQQCPACSGVRNGP